MINEVAVLVRESLNKFVSWGVEDVEDEIDKSRFADALSYEKGKRDCLVILIQYCTTVKGDPLRLTLDLPHLGIKRISFVLCSSRTFRTLY
jgi:hypothetical protein